MDNRGQWEGNVACVVQSGSARGGKGLWVRRVWPAYGARALRAVSGRCRRHVTHPGVGCVETQHGEQHLLFIRPNVDLI